MKLIRQTKLAFQEGNSDKVYEVDLCEVGGNQYLVNFRYGKRGAPLREGTKTSQPADLATAEKLYSKLVQGKVKKGYRDVSLQVAAKAAPAPKGPQGPKQRDAHILRHLVNATQGTHDEKHWKITRVMWRAGELRIKEAAPHIMAIAEAKADLHKYCALWALGRCGDPKALPLVQKYVKSTNRSLRGIAREAAMALLDGTARDAFILELLNEVPDDLRQNVVDGTHESLIAVLNELTFARKSKEYHYLEIIYAASLEYQHARSALIEILPKISARPSHFRNLRHIWKQAEFRQDGQVFGLIAYKFEKERAMFNSPTWGNEIYFDRSWVDISKELKKPGSRIAFGSKTKEYLKRRSWRTLQRTGDIADAAYVKLAVGILLSYDDTKDKDRPWKTTRWNYNRTTRRYDKTHTHFDSYSKYFSLYRILYGNSPRYELKKGATAFNCKGGYEPGQAAPTVREELYPELWDKMPQAYFHLLGESKVERVDDFAIAGLKRHEDLLAQVDVDFIIRLISKPFHKTVDFGVEIARKIYDPAKPNFNLVSALANSPVKSARDLAMDWIKSNRYLFFKDSNFVCSLITSYYTDVRHWTKEQITSIAFSPEQADALIMRVFVELLSMQEDETKAKDIGEILMLAFGDKLQKISIQAIRDLLAHSLSEVQAFGGRLLLRNNTRPQDLPDDIFPILLEANSATVREIGIELFGQLPDETLLGKRGSLVAFCLSPLEDIRKAVRPIIARLAAKDAIFGKELTEAFIPKLWKKEKYEGLHEELLLLLSTDLEVFLAEVDKEISLRLLNAKYSPAHQLGVILLKKNIDAKSLTMRQIIRIGNHEILEARKIAWAMYSNNIDRVKYEKEEALRLLDSKWDDAREFAFEFFRNNFGEGDWTPTLLVGVCDSVRVDVQAFGRELITKFFKDENGMEYLLKLSQHPKAELQLFATNYLTRFAAGNLENIQKLEHYFVTVLSLVNKARVAKDRVLQFLHQEALKNAEAAKLATRILTRISATSAIEDKATCMEILIAIKDKYPYIQVPLEKRAIPVR